MFVIMNHVALDEILTCNCRVKGEFVYAVVRSHVFLYRNGGGFKLLYIQW